jgi:hypothetical protein
MTSCWVGALLLAMQWGFGYLSRQFCACQRAVRCASVGWSLPDAAICHPDWRRIGSDVWAGKSWPPHRAPTSSVTMDAWPRTTSAPSHPSGLFSGLRATRSMP